LLEFLNNKYSGKNKNILYADSSRKKEENNYKLSLHAIVNDMGYFSNRNALKKIILKFINFLHKTKFYKKKSFVDDDVYHQSQLMRIIYSPNKSADSILKPFMIENEKIINKDIEYIANNYALSLCGNYNNTSDQLDYSLPETVVNEYDVEYNKPDRKEDSYNIPNWKINWIKNSNYIKNIYKIDNIIGNKVNLLRIISNTYCKLCGRNHDKDNAFCKVYKNNIIFYCNRNKKGISIGSWYDEKQDNNNDIIDILSAENKILKEKIEKLEIEIETLKNSNNACGKMNIPNKWNRYYMCGKLIFNDKIKEFKNIISQEWKDKNISKVKNRCLRIYKMVEYMKLYKKDNITISLRSIFNLPNIKFEHYLKNNLFP
jgi:hypothetical protein